VGIPRLLFPVQIPLLHNIADPRGIVSSTVPSFSSVFSFSLKTVALKKERKPKGYICMKLLLDALGCACEKILTRKRNVLRLQDFTR